MKKNGARFVAKDEHDWRPAPETSSLTVLKNASKSCAACHLYKHATQMVFGEGAKGATLILLGEQPGDQEDLAGKPFVEIRQCLRREGEVVAPLATPFGRAAPHESARHE